MLKLDILLYLNTCFLLCASCRNRTSNKFISPGAIQAHCPHCGETGEWRLEEAYWPELRAAVEERPSSIASDSSMLSRKRG